MKTPTKKTSTDKLCELCGLKKPTSFSYVDGKWKAVCDCSCETEDYYIQIKDYFINQCRWDDHMREKGWFNKRAFGDMLARYIDIDEIINSYLPISNRKANCPFHKDKKESLKTNGFLFGCICRAYGNALDFIRVYEQTDTDTAFEILEELR